MPEWIPCSERMPEPKQWCLVTCLDSNGSAFVDAPSSYHRDHWINDFGRTYSPVVAWMPLPEPWRENA